MPRHTATDRTDPDRLDVPVRVAQELSQQQAVEAQDGPRVVDVAHQPRELRVGVVKKRLYAEDLMVEFGIGRSAFYALVKAGKFTAFELERIGRHRAWHPSVVEHFNATFRVEDRSWGRKTFGPRGVVRKVR